MRGGKLGTEGSGQGVHGRRQGITGAAVIGEGPAEGIGDAARGNDHPLRWHCETTGQDGGVTGVVVRDLHETYGLGREALTDTAFLGQFLGTAGEASVGKDIEALTGATVTSKAIAKGVNSAAAFVTGADVSSSATEWGDW